MAGHLSVCKYFNEKSMLFLRAENVLKSCNAVFSVTQKVSCVILNIAEPRGVVQGTTTKSPVKIGHIVPEFSRNKQKEIPKL